MFGKAGRAETATDPAPLEMFETTIQFKPRDQWRAGHDAGQAGRGARPHRARCPGSSNIWVPPIRNRIDMLATGIKSPVGIKVAGADLARSTASTAEIERVGQATCRGHLGARRAADRRPLRRRRRSTATPRRATA